MQLGFVCHCVCSLCVVIGLLVSVGICQPSPSCTQELGVASGFLSSQLITASSTYTKSAPKKPKSPMINYVYYPGDARLNTKLGFGGWAPATDSASEFWQVNFTEIVRIASVSTQGFKSRTEKEKRFVTSYNVYVSLDGTSFTRVSPGSGRTSFSANTDEIAVVTKVFATPVSAVVLRLTNFTVAMGAKGGLRAGIYGCKPPSFLSDLQGCDQPFGMTSGAISDNSIASNTEDGPGFRARYGRLNRTLGNGGWCGKKPVDKVDYFRVDLGRRRYVSAVATQGVRDGRATLYVSKYEVRYGATSSSVSTLVPVAASTSTSPQAFTGNNDATTVNKQYFSQPFYARYVVLGVFAVDSDIDTCLRMEVYGCDRLPTMAASTASLAPPTTRQAPAASSASTATAPVASFASNTARPVQTATTPTGRLPAASSTPRTSSLPGNTVSAATTSSAVAAQSTSGMSTSVIVGLAVAVGALCMIVAGLLLRRVYKKRAKTRISSTSSSHGLVTTGRVSESALYNAKTSTVSSSVGSRIAVNALYSPAAIGYRSEGGEKSTSDEYAYASQDEEVPPSPAMMLRISTSNGGPLRHSPNPSPKPPRPHVKKSQPHVNDDDELYESYEARCGDYSDVAGDHDSEPPCGDDSAAKVMSPASGGRVLSGKSQPRVSDDDELYESYEARSGDYSDVPGDHDSGNDYDEVAGANYYLDVAVDGSED